MTLLASTLAVMPGLLQVAAPRTPGPCRNRLEWPFATTSIWNTAIGSAAVYRPAQLFGGQAAGPDIGDCHAPELHPETRVSCPGAFGGITRAECEARGCCFSSTPPVGYPYCFAQRHTVGPTEFHNDPDRFVQLRDDDPPTEWYDQGWWGPTPAAFKGSCAPSTANAWCHCVRLPAAQLVGQIPLPANWSTGSAGNNGVAFLLPDGVSVLQLQPVYRCSGAGVTTPLYASRDIFCGNGGACPPGPVPRLYPLCVSILGDGAEGAHGGSGLSVLGGSVRLAEVAPGAPPIPHVLKLELYAHRYYYGVVQASGHRLQNKTQANGGRTQYVWPATSSDNYCCWPKHPLAYNGSLPYLAPGALLAIPPSVAETVRTTTVLGGKVKQALIDYGGYIVDDTASDSAAVIFEHAAEAEVGRLYNITLGTSSGPWYTDLVAIFQALHVVANNGAGTVGGGGRPRAPLAPPICGSTGPDGASAPSPPVCNA